MDGIGAFTGRKFKGRQGPFKGLVFTVIADDRENPKRRVTLRFALADREIQITDQEFYDANCVEV